MLTFIFQWLLHLCIIVLNAKNLGALSNKVLRDLEVFDTDVSLAIINSSKELKRASGVKQIKTTKVKLENQAFNTQSSQDALRYLNNRYNDL